MANPPAYQYYAADFDEDTASWDVNEVGIYQRLLNYEWINGWDQEGLPNDRKRLARIARCSYKKFLKGWTIIEKKFSQNGKGFLVNRRMEEGREKLLKYIESQRESGKRGAEKRWKQDGDPIAEPISDPNDEPYGQKMALPSSSSLKKEKDMQIPSATPALLFPLKDGTEYPLELAKISEYEKTYYNIDVMFELKKCLQWDIDRPKERKTKTGILKHINFWLSNESKQKGPPIQKGIEHDNKAVEEAREDMKRRDPEKTRAKIHDLAMGVTKEAP